VVHDRTPVALAEVADPVTNSIGKERGVSVAVNHSIAQCASLAYPLHMMHWWWTRWRARMVLLSTRQRWPRGWVKCLLWHGRRR
jgi:hypothetical protein